MEESSSRTETAPRVINHKRGVMVLPLLATDCKIPNLLYSVIRISFSREEISSCSVCVVSRPQRNTIPSSDVWLREIILKSSSKDPGSCGLTVNVFSPVRTVLFARVTRVQVTPTESNVSPRSCPTPPVSSNITH